MEWTRPSGVISTTTIYSSVSLDLLGQEADRGHRGSMKILLALSGVSLRVVDRMIQLQGTYLGAIELRTLNTQRFLFRLPKLLSRWRRQSHSRTYPLSMKLNISCGVTIRRPVTGKNTSEGARL